MGYADLREFVRRLEKEGELRRVRAEVDPVLEIVEVVQRAQAQPGPKGNPGGMALLFEKPKGSKFPLLVNTFGSVRRMELAFEVGRLEEVADRVEATLQERPEKEIATADVGAFVMEELKTLDKVAYVRFASVYRHFRDIGEFMSELKDLLNAKE